MSEFKELLNQKAVALTYNEHRQAAPVIVASGMGYMAEKIIEQQRKMEFLSMKTIHWLLCSPSWSWAQKCRKNYIRQLWIFICIFWTMSLRKKTNRKDKINEKRTVLPELFGYSLFLLM